MPQPVVDIRDVAPRDGLQVERVVAPERRALVVEALVGAGLRDIEVCSFVSPSRVPAMAGAAELVARLPVVAGVRYWALVPNRRGAELAVAAGVEALTVTVSASPGYSRKNVGMEVDESVRAVADIAEAAGGATIDVVVSCAFGSPFDDVAGPAAVVAVVDAVRAAAPVAVTLADTTGAASPRRIRQVVDEVGPGVGLHLHDTRGAALLNAHVALELGVTRFDTALGGLGGSPFAPGAGGNLATEDLVAVLADLGRPTGVDPAELAAAARLLEELVGHPLRSQTSAAGPPPAFGHVE